MRITCPSCAAEYDVPGELAPGRAVKCAKCGTRWAPVPPPPPPPAIIEAKAEPVAPIPPPPAPRPPPVAPVPLAVTVKPAPRRLPLLLAWAASVLVLAGLVAAAIVWRDPVMAAWPPSIRAYAALGLTARP